MGDLENFEEIEEPIEGEVVPEKDNSKFKTLAKTILILGGLYLLNPLLGIDLLPDNLPIVGNLDEVLAVFMMLGAVRYLGISLPGFLERWMETPLGLPAPRDRQE